MLGELFLRISVNLMLQDQDDSGTVGSIDEAGT